jgi:hypothetical protein
MEETGTCLLDQFGVGRLGIGVLTKSHLFKNERYILLEKNLDTENISWLD